ncbi:site-2 protease family protein [Jannaschia sp. R86511]|uniref:site-2 protease family protein n=1 Tax=Jannaschia sp. R86511 TaxID=3093853 RepID=UPI0036D2CCC0
MSSPGPRPSPGRPRRGPDRRPGPAPVTIKDVTLARVGGVPVRLSASWLIIAAVITFLFAGTASSATGVPGIGAYLIAFVLAVLLAVSVLLHEAGHAVAARAYGLPVTEVVVNLWGGHTSLGRPQSPGASAVVSVVGPLVNIALAVLAEAVRRQLPATVPGSAAAVVAFLLLGVALTNALVGVFNLVPGLPLDGGRVLEALVWKVTGDQDTAGVVAGWAGRVVAVALVAWLVLPPLLAGRVPSTFTLVWGGLVGLFLWRGASAALKVGTFRRRAARVDLASVTRPAAVAAATATVAELVGHQGDLGGALDVVLVDAAGRPVALVPGGSVAAVPDDLRTTTPASALARTLPPGSVVPVAGGALGAVEGLARSGEQGIVLVDGAGRPAGRVRPDDFATAMGLS